jgi:hypothetical protein
VLKLKAVDARKGLLRMVAQKDWKSFWERLTEKEWENQ